MTLLRIVAWTVGGVILLGALAYGALVLAMLREPRDWR